MIGQTISHYRIIEKLGSGGMGVVYRARDEQLERDVAIKTLPLGTLGDDNARKRFRKEALSLAKLNHPGIATIHEFSSQDGTDFLVTEYIPGISLDHKLADGALPVKEVIALGLQLAQGLAAAHEQGIVHRDLKPANLRLMPDGRLKILDFGLAQLMPRASDMGLTETRTEFHEITGTLPYMAPEQLRGEPADARTDIWATGAVCYEMATGRRPFPEKSNPLLINSILNQKPEPPSKLNGEVSLGLEIIILKALDKDSALRHQTALELGLDLERLSAGALSPVLPGSSLWRYATVVGTFAVLLLLVVSGLVLVHRRRDQEQAASGTVNHRRSVAVLGFKNLAGKTDEAWLSTAISEMLTTELSAGEQLRTVPGEAVAHIKSNLALADAESYAKETLNKIHAQTSADDIIVGSYLALGAAADGKVYLDLKLQDTHAGETIAAFSEEGKEIELTELVSRAGARLRQKLGASDLAPSDLAAIKASSPSTTEAVRLYSEGLAKLRTYDERAALDLLQKAVAADPNYALAHSALSEAWGGIGNHDQEKEEAKRAFDLSVNLSREDRLLIEAIYRDTTQDRQKVQEIYKTLFGLHPDDLDYGLRFAQSQLGLGKGQEALAILESLRKLPAPERDDPRIDLAEGDAADSVSNLQLAHAAYRRAIKKGNESGARLIVAQALDSDGSVYHDKGETDQAMVAWEHAKTIYADVGDQNLSASVLNEIAMLLDDAGDVARAEKMYRESRDIYTQTGNDYALWSDLKNLGDTNEHLGNLKDAMESYQQALVISRKVESKFMESISLRGIGDTLQRQGDPRGTRQFYEKSLEVCRESKQLGTLQMGLFTLADLLEAQGDLPRAQSLLQERLELSRKSERKSEMGFSLQLLAMLLVRKSQLSEARAKYEQARSIRAELGETDGAAQNRLGLAEVSLEEGRPADAEAAAREAREVFRRDRDVFLELGAVTLLARALLMEGKLNEATTEVDQAKSLWGKSLMFQQNFGIGILSARILAQGHDPAEAEKRLNLLLDESTRAGLVEQQFEIRLALGEIEMSSGKTAAGHVRLAALVKDARSRGFLLIARKAADAAKASVVRPSLQKKT